VSIKKSLNDMSTSRKPAQNKTTAQTALLFMPSLAQAARTFTDLRQIRRRNIEDEARRNTAAI
jgi:hypothetical protein